MADAKITELTALTSLLGTDIFPVVGDPGGTPVTKKITAANIAAFLAALAETLTNKTLTSPKINENVELTATATILNALAAGGVTTRLLSKRKEITRDGTATGGDVSYTGVGFQPTALIATAFVNGTLYRSDGHCDSSLSEVCSYESAANVYNGSYSLIMYSNQGSWAQSAIVKSFDADGFTLTWAKTGTVPTGTITAQILCLR